MGPGARARLAAASGRPAALPATDLHQCSPLAPAPLAQVREAVDALLGGHVPHSAADAERLSDDDKVARRLTAMNLMHLGGWPPKLIYWREAGTLMHSVQAVTDGYVTVYVATCMSRAAAHAATRPFLEQLPFYTSAADVILAVLAAVLPPAGPDARPAKRRRGERGERGGAVTLHVRTMTGKVFQISIDRAGALVAHVKLAIQNAERIPIDQQRVIYDGRQLSACETLAEAGLEDAATIHLVLRLKGCWPGRPAARGRPRAGAQCSRATTPPAVAHGSMNCASPKHVGSFAPPRFLLGVSFAVRMLMFRWGCCWCCLVRVG